MFFAYWRPHRLQTLEIKKMPQEHMKFYRLAKKSFEVYSLQSKIMTVVKDSKNILILRPFKWLFDRNNERATYILVTARSSRILIGKQKLGVAFNSDKLGGTDFTKFSKLSMCSAGAGRCWLVQWPGLPPRHCTWSVLKFL